MERSAPEYSQSGLPSPYPSTFGDTHSEASSADHPSAAQYATQQEVRPSNYQAAATPTSEYSVYPPSARSSSFPEHLQQRSYHPSGTPSTGSMAQQASNPSIAAPSPTYPAHGQYSPYAAPSQEGMPHYPHSSGLYAQPRPDWSGYSGHSGGPITPGHHVYSFVPIPGAQQHKRPRRRYEEIERMYKCGWGGCEKAYGTLNHLNAHVTMQSHGVKRTPEEFKEIRKEWKQRKKDEEASRKAEDERARQAAVAAQQNGASDGQSGGDSTNPPGPYAGGRPVQLPPIGYQPNQYPQPPSAGVQHGDPAVYGSSYMPGGSYQPASPYGQPNQQQMYSQR